MTRSTIFGPAFPVICGLMLPLALTAATAPARAQDVHYYSLVSVDVTGAELADDNAKRAFDGSIQLSIVRVPDSGPIAYSMSLVMLNCASLQNQVLSETNFGTDGKQVVLPAETQSTPIKAGTLGEVLKRYICDGLDPYPRSKSIKGLDAAVERAHTLIDAEKEKGK